MPNRTISVPNNVVPVIDALDMPFSQWVTEQLRRHAAESTVTFAGQLVRDGALARADKRPSKARARDVGQRMERSAPW